MTIISLKDYIMKCESKRNKLLINLYIKSKNEKFDRVHK